VAFGAVGSHAGARGHGAGADDGLELLDGVDVIQRRSWAMARVSTAL